MQKARAPVSICGELAGELEMTELLLGMGLRQYSMHPSQILPLKERLFTFRPRIPHGWPRACCASPIR